MREGVECHGVETIAVARTTDWPERRKLGAEGTWAARIFISPVAPKPRAFFRFPGPLGRIAGPAEVFPEMLIRFAKSCLIEVSFHRKLTASTECRHSCNDGGGGEHG